MSNAQEYLDLVRKRGKEGKKLNKVYRNIKNSGLFLAAYSKLYANKGATTPGVDSKDTVDGMSLERINSIIEKLEKGIYKWKPVRRTFIDKKNSIKKRPLGIPGWTDKMLEEVIKMVLEAYYEPQFRESSHGFRPRRGVHTALEQILKWKGTTWFIEGDIKGCFDNISQEKLLSIIGQNISDERLLKLLKDMLKVGYVQNWKYHRTYSGTPQGGIISPLLANIFLNELDKFVEDVLIPKHTKGKKRIENLEYVRLFKEAEKARRQGKWEYAKALKKVYTKMPSKNANDLEFRRLWYVRYADDFILGYIGTKAEARMIKEEIKEFLSGIDLKLSEEKTLITHATTGRARFLNYEINKANNQKMIESKRGTKRSGNASIWLSIPQDVVEFWESKVRRGEKIIHRTEITDLSDYDIITIYETELQGLINYYSMARNVVTKMSYLRYIWGESLVKTLAAKYKTKGTKIWKKYKMYTVTGRKLIGIQIEREGKKPLIATFGRRKIERVIKAPIKDDKQNMYIKRNELVERLLAKKCELCDKEDIPVYGHHINKLKNLKNKYKGRKQPSEWVKRMIEIRRKVLFVCAECHRKIHNGKYDGAKIT